MPKIGFPMSKSILLAVLAVGAALVVLAAGIDQTIIGDLAGPALLNAAERPEGIAGDAQDYLPGSAEKFSFLTRQSSNSCGLRPEVLELYHEDSRLQGSCCSPIALHRYQEQVEGLRAYRSIAVIPEDPYDIPVRLAKELLGYQRSIALSEDQSSRYQQAVSLSAEGGPCCCRCWRWDAFEGQAKYLITEYDWSAEQIAAPWELEDGCGGDGHLGHG